MLPFDSAPSQLSLIRGTTARKNTRHKIVSPFVARARNAVDQVRGVRVQVVRCTTISN